MVRVTENYVDDAASARRETLVDSVLLVAASAEDVGSKVDPPESTVEQREELEEHHDSPATETGVLIEHSKEVVVINEEFPRFSYQEEEKKDEEPGQPGPSVKPATLIPPPNATIKKLFEQHLPGVVADEELGLVAMFQEIHQSMPEVPGKELARTTMAHIFAAWADVQKKAIEAASSSSSSSNESNSGGSPRSSTATQLEATEDVSMAAMFREIGDALPGVQRDAAESMDAILANMLLAVSHVPELVSPTVTANSVVSKDEDLSLAGMFKEIASLIPGGNVSEKQVEKHIVDRVEQMMTFD